MKKIKTLEKFPIWMILVSNLVSILTYVIGAYIMYKFGVAFLVFYLLYCLFMEYNVLRRSCVNCYYYGKLCGFGKGVICKLFFKIGNKKAFLNKKISMWDLVPDFLVTLIPFAFGVILLFKNFSWIILFLSLSLIFIAFFGNYAVRGFIACRYCKQREIGCPAEKMFNRKK
jgi:hypothetical protein